MWSLAENSTALLHMEDNMGCLNMPTCPETTKVFKEHMLFKDKKRVTKGWKPGQPVAVKHEESNLDGK